MSFLERQAGPGTIGISNRMPFGAGMVLELLAALAIKPSGVPFQGAVRDFAGGSSAEIVTLCFTRETADSASSLIYKK